MIEINNRKIGPDEPTYFIAEVGSNHDGSLDRAKRLIELASRSGADAVKFQNFRANRIVSRRGFDELGQIGHQSEWKKSVYDTYFDAETPLAWTSILVEVCRDYGVAYLTTPYDLVIVEELDEFVPAWKIGSGDIDWYELIELVASKDKPIFLATGAASEWEVEKAVGLIPDDVPLVLMQCNSNYSGDYDLSYLNLRVIESWIEGAETDILVGFSDHSPGIEAVMTAVTLGACVVEKHFTDDPSRPGPDHAFALGPGEFASAVQSATLVRRSLGNGFKKVEENEADSRVVQRRAIRWKRRLYYDMVVRREDLVVTRPCPEGALGPDEINLVVGKTLVRDVEEDILVREEDLK
jgi:sialic acid synthase SpsE